MGKVTYGIRFSQKSPFAQEIKERKQRLKGLVTQGKQLDAAKSCIDLGELLLHQADYDDTQDDQIQSLAQALRYCVKANQVFEHSQKYHWLARSLTLMVQCYQKQEDYDKAIEHNRQLIELFKQPDAKVKSKTMLQQAYKLMGDGFFCRAQLDPGRSKHDDMANANKYYEKERTVLDRLSAKEVGDNDAWREMLRSSHFNLGVAKAKLRPFMDDRAAEQSLKQAINDSHRMHDVAHERRTWWELGNLYYRQREWDKTLECQRKELAFGQSLEEDELASYIDLMRTCLEISDYKSCMVLVREMRKLVGDDEQGMATQSLDEDGDERKELVELAVNRVAAVRDRRSELEELSERNVTGRPMAMACLALGEAQTEADMLASALHTVQLGLMQFDSKNKSEPLLLSMGTLHLRLLELKANLHWHLRDLSLDDTIKLNRQIINDAKQYCTDKEKAVEYISAAVERNRDIYAYYNQPEKAAQWDQHLDHILDTTDDVEMAYDQSSQSESLGPASPPLLKLSKPLFDLAQVKTTMSMIVNVPLKCKEVQIGVICEDTMETMDWLACRVASLCWEQHGIQPKITQFYLQDHPLDMDDVLTKLLDLAGRRTYHLEAVVNGLVEKPLIDLYNNVCARRSEKPSPLIQEVLKDQATSSKISLRGSGLCHEQLDTIIEWLNLVPDVITELDLSANLLRDEDIRRMMGALTFIPTHLNLSSNLLTATTLEYLLSEHNAHFQKLYFAYNLLDALTKQQLTDLYTSHPDLQLLDVQGSHALPVAPWKQ
ncbi:hypothetical protein BC940DRAFT_293798 [Gongronella butleri]|nr:hypothetical protein BC940DRAFT_293798 [Gongronella butleri]